MFLGLKKYVQIRIDKINFIFKFDFIYNVYINNADIQLLALMLKKITNKN